MLRNTGGVVMVEHAFGTSTDAKQDTAEQREVAGAIELIREHTKSLPRRILLLGRSDLVQVMDLLKKGVTNITALCTSREEHIACASAEITEKQLFTMVCARNVLSPSENSHHAKFLRGFDAAILLGSSLESFVGEHNPEQVLCNIAAALKPKGVLVVGCTKAEIVLLDDSLKACLYAANMSDIKYILRLKAGEPSYWIATKNTY
jgi:hypothetical protein